MPVHRNVPAATPSRRLMRIALVGLMSVAVRQLPAQAVDARWKVSGDAGLAVGGSWLHGDGAPDIESGTGAELSLRALRGFHARSSGGVALRVAAQQLRLRENGSEWDGPTLTTGALLAVSSTRIARTAAWESALELGAGAALLTGARSLFPFSTASRLAPALEAGLSLQHETPETSGDRPRRSIIGQTGFFARYQMLRVDPGAVPSGSPSASGITGWAGRVAVGLRVDR